MVCESARSTPSRHVENYAHISEELVEVGFEFVLSQDLSLDWQLRIFRSARHSVMDGGAAIASLLFERSCEDVVLLAMDDGTDSSLFVSLCQSLGVKITYVCGPVSPKQEVIDPWQRTYRTPMDLLYRALS